MSDPPSLITVVFPRNLRIQPIASMSVSAFAIASVVPFKSLPISLELPGNGPVQQIQNFAKKNIHPEKLAIKINKRRRDTDRAGDAK